jgi:type II secretory pathway pseudopilin PulG
MKKFGLVLMVLMGLSASSYASKYVHGSTSARQDSAAINNQIAREQFEQHQKNNKPKTNIPSLEPSGVWNAPVFIDCYDTNINQWTKCEVQTLKEKP